MRQVLPAPTHDTVDRRNRSALNKPSERLSLPVIELGRLACRLAVNQTIRPLGVETENPVTAPPGARQYRSAPPPCDGHHRKSQPAQEAAGSVQHPSTPWLTAEAPDHQNLPVTQPLCPWRTSVSVRLIDSDFLPFGNPLNESSFNARWYKSSSGTSSTTTSSGTSYLTSTVSSGIRPRLSMWTSFSSRDSAGPVAQYVTGWPRVFQRPAFSTPYPPSRRLAQSAPESRHSRIRRPPPR